MRSSLFRQEVLDAQTGQWAGVIILRRPVSMRVAATVSVLLALALAALLIGGRYTRNVTVGGKLVPGGGAVKTVAPQFGRVIAKRVSEGQFVAEGQVLYELSSERSVAEGGVEQRVGIALLARRRLVEQERQVLQQQLRQRQSDLDVRRQLLGDELRGIEQELKLQQKRAAIAAGTVQRYRALRDQGYISEIQLTQVEGEYVDQQLRQQATARNRLSLARELALLQAEAIQLENQVAISRLQVDKALAVLEQESAEQQGRGGSLVLSPMRGTVTALTVEKGETVSAGAVLATVLPSEHDFAAQLLVPSNAIGFVSAGQPVRMRIAAFPYQKFGYLTGTVQHVERGPREETVDGAKLDAHFRVFVRLDRQSVQAYGRSRALKAGMTLHADIRQETRRLIEWLFDPIRSAVQIPVT